VSFDAQGRALFVWDGVPTASQPRFTGMASRAPGGHWTRLANLPDVGWGNAQALQYAATRVLFVSGQVASVGAYNRAKLRLIVAYGRSDGSGLGRWRTLAPRETGFVAAANHSGQAIVVFDAGGNGLSTIQRPSDGKFGRATKVSPAGALAPAVAINGHGDRIVAWIRSGRIEARVRNAGQGWGSLLNVARAPGVPNTSLRAAVTAGGSFVLAWDAADIRESRPTRLIAGTAQRRPGKGWHAYPLENATLRINGGFVSENALAFALVTGNGAIAITWTGAVDDNARVAVKAARLTSTGPRAPKSSRATRRTPRSATRPWDRAARRRSFGLSSMPRPAPPPTPRCRPGRASRSARPTCSRPPKRPASAAQPSGSRRSPARRSRWSRSSRATAAASCRQRRRHSAAPTSSPPGATSRTERPRDRRPRR
jgi:hypothetical protein